MTQPHSVLVGLGLAFLGLVVAIVSASVILKIPPADLIEKDFSPTSLPTYSPVPKDKSSIPLSQDNVPTATQSGAKQWNALIEARWQWQLDTPVDTTVKAQVFDIDYETATTQLVASLHAKGAQVICYVSVGSYENWRSDAKDFPLAVVGKEYAGWPGEKWLDIRQIDLLMPILSKRFDICRDKGFDAIEPDNIQGYQADTGFPLTSDDQVKFNRWVAREAHDRGLRIGLKNDNDQAHLLESSFDFAITEDCFAQGWCSDLSVFIEHGKPVFAAEYTDTGVKKAMFCEVAKRLHFSVILKNRNLDSFIEWCP